MNLTRWIVRPGERKQISLVKIPQEEVKKHRITDGQTKNIAIKSENQTLYQGPLRVTSGQELYIPKVIREILEKENKLYFEIISLGVGV